MASIDVTSTPPTRGYTATKDQLLKRLRRIEGQVRGVEGMVEDDRYCIDVLTQISAIHAALDKVALGLLDEHARHCVMGADGAEQRRKTEELMAAVGAPDAPGLSRCRHAHAGHDTGQSLNRLALSATVHCLTGCAIGEVLGMVIGTALGWSNVATIALVDRARLLLRLRPDEPAAAALRAWRCAASRRSRFASDTLSITTMEIVDNAHHAAHPRRHGRRPRRRRSSGAASPSPC